MVYYIFRRFTRLIIIVVFSVFLLQGCVWIVAGVAAGGVAAVALIGGSVAQTDRTHMALAVEKAVYAIEKEGGVVTDLSFADGYAIGKVDGYKVAIHIYQIDGGSVDISVRASKYLISNSKLAEKILNNYRNFTK